MLVEMTSSLGPHYVAFVVDVLIATLPQRGYTAHVLSYTLDKVLGSIDPSVHPPGVFDEILQPLVSVIDDECFGPIGESKDATEYGGGIREVKKRPAASIYQ